MFVRVCSQYFICFADVCCKCVYLDVGYISRICCKYFIWILRMFAIVFKCFSGVSSVLSVFRRMLQVLDLDILKVDRMLHICLLCDLPAVATGRYVGGQAGA
jgi:hypothetical protein